MQQHSSVVSGELKKKNHYHFHFSFFFSRFYFTLNYGLGTMLFEFVEKKRDPCLAEHLLMLYFVVPILRGNPMPAVTPG